MPLPLAHDQLYGASRGIAYLHGLGTPIVHGDIKPENIMIQNNEEAGICDFGISKILVAHGQRSGLTTSGNTPGTCRFQAPEVLENDPATTSSDVFALAGVILFVSSFFLTLLSDATSKPSLL